MKFEDIALRRAFIIRLTALVLFSVTAACFAGGCVSSTPKSEAETEFDPDFTLIESNDRVPNTDKGRNTHKFPELNKAFEDAFRDELVLINNYTMSQGYSNAADIILCIKRYLLKESLIKELMPDALAALRKKAEELYPDRRIDCKEQITYPTWQYLAATLPFTEDEEFLFYNVLRLDIDVNDEVSGIATVTVSTAPVPIQEFSAAQAKLAATEQDAADIYIDTRFTYAYLSAVYGANGEEIVSYEPYYFDEKYTDKLVFPLDNVPEFHDTWAQGRSSNTRLHMGTDIRNPEGEPVYSCSSGVLLYKGFSKIPGNFTIVLDEDGYEYHYYHLVEIPSDSEVNAGDSISPGDFVGRVGCTGNSDVNHLHIAIIAPTGEFVNPYMLMVQLAERDAAKLP